MSKDKDFSTLAPDLPRTFPRSREGSRGPVGDPDGERAQRRAIRHAKRPRRTGLQALSRATRAAIVGQLDIAAGQLDGRTAVARELQRYRLELADIYRQRHQVEPPRTAEVLIDIMATDRLVQSSVDAIIQELGAAGQLYDADKRTLVSLLRERAYLVAGQVERLRLLGLEPADEPETVNLAGHLAKRYHGKRAAEAQDEPDEPGDPEPSAEG